MRRLVVLTMAAAAAGLPARAVPLEACSPEVVIGTGACMTIDSAALGGTTAFSYYVPTACASGGCPVLYLFHGHASDHRQHIDGDPSTLPYEPGVWERALTAGPRAGFEEAPWEHADQDYWVPRAVLDIILVGPHGQTVPGGFGPGPNVQGFWVDWNPRYAHGDGEPNRYAGPPPRFETFVVDELVPFVDAILPTGGTRAHRGVIGTALGAFGAVGIGLKHPDTFAAIGSVSGALNLYLAPGLDPSTPDSLGLGPPVEAGPLNAPGPLAQPSLTALPGDLGIFATVLTALGDPAVDQAYYRGNTPRDLALNARAFAGDEHAVYLQHIVNDAIPRRAGDLAPPGVLTDVAFEALMLDMNVSQQLAYDNLGVPNGFELHPGLHSDAYRIAWLRGFLENMAANLAGSGEARAEPTSFDFRTISSDAEAWGWRFARAADGPVEFLNVFGASCDGVMTVRGTGEVHVSTTVCPGSGFDLDLDGSVDVLPSDGVLATTIDLGARWLIDEPAGASATSAYQPSARVGVVPIP